MKRVLFRGRLAVVVAASGFMFAACTGPVQNETPAGTLPGYTTDVIVIQVQCIPDNDDEPGYPLAGAAVHVALLDVNHTDPLTGEGVLRATRDSATGANGSCTFAVTYSGEESLAADLVRFRAAWGSYGSYTGTVQLENHHARGVASLNCR